MSLCHYVYKYKGMSGPSPDPSPAGRGVITELPLPSCCSLLTVLVGLM